MTQTINSTDSELKKAVILELSWLSSIDSSHTRWAARTDTDLAREAAEALERAVNVPGITATTNNPTIQY